MLIVSGPPLDSLDSQCTSNSYIPHSLLKNRKKEFSFTAWMERGYLLSSSFSTLLGGTAQGQQQGGTT